MLPESVVDFLLRLFSSFEATAYYDLQVLFKTLEEHVLLERIFCRLEGEYSAGDYRIRITHLTLGRSKWEREIGLDLFFSLSYRDPYRGEFTKFFIAQAKKCKCRPRRAAFYLYPSLWNGNIGDRELREQCKKMLSFTSESYILILTDLCGVFFCPATVAYYPYRLSCRTISNAMPSTEFYLNFLECYIGEVIKDKYFSNIKDALSFLSEMRKTREALVNIHVAIEREKYTEET